MKILIVLCLVAAVSADFADYQKRHGKKYKDAEHAAQAKAHFERHGKLFAKHNAKFAAGEVLFQVGENQFTDQNITEVIAQICRSSRTKRMRALPALPATFPTGAASKDWTSIMQPIVDQGQCGSCWAFATVAQLESLYKRNSSAYANYILSQQYLVDCDPYDGGCDGGYPANAMTYIKSTGIPLAAKYPYTAVQTTCKSPVPAFVAPKIFTKVNDYDLNGNETLLRDIVSQQGPIAVGIYATDLLMQYTTGIFHDTACAAFTSCEGNHAVVVVGYGTDASGHDYWLVRNSWSTTWGEKGYVRIQRNGNNMCNIACSAMWMN